MIKPVNLLSMIDAKHILSEPLFQAYLGHFGVDVAINGNKSGIKKSELDDIEHFYQKINECSGIEINFYDGFYVGYHIPQIGKEFDLLRMGHNYLINIEIKSQAEPEKVKAQLKKNRYYLGFLNKPIHLFSYVVNTDSFYWLDGNDDLVAIDRNALVEIISQQQLDDCSNLDNLFKPSYYLVSPFNSTDKFVAGEYFLTNQQLEIKEKVLSLIEHDRNQFISITGAAGTGKTLLIYDIARHLMSLNKKVLILHCAKRNSGQDFLVRTHRWNINSTSYAINDDFSPFDLIIVDESQRAKQEQFHTIVRKTQEESKYCIFSYDMRQCLDDTEINREIPRQIESLPGITSFKLTDKIRTNKEIASFIRLLFDKNKQKTAYDYSNVEVNFFDDREKAKRFLTSLQNSGWRIPKYTPGKMNKTFQYENYLVTGEDSTHAVIGQEFEKVAAVIDEYFDYNETGKLHSTAPGWYSQTKMLFQILTRTREKLFVVIINNPIMLMRCLDILHNR